MFVTKWQSDVLIIICFLSGQIKVAEPTKATRLNSCLVKWNSIFYMGVWLLWESGWLNSAWGGVFFPSLHRADTPLLLQRVGGLSLSPISCVCVSCFWLSSLCSEGKYPLLKSFNMIPALLRKWQIRMGVTSRIDAFIMASPTSTRHNMWFSVTACVALKCRRFMSCSKTQHSSTQMQEDADCLALLGDREIMHNNAACFLLIKLAGTSQSER